MNLQFFVCQRATIAVMLCLTGCDLEQRPTTAGPAPASSNYEMITLLPPDAIPAIDHPPFLPADEADSEYSASELVLGVEIDGDARAYSIPFLSGHEIVNDTVAGVPIAVTW